MTIAFLAPLAAAAEALVQGPKVTPKVEPEVEALAKEKALVTSFDPRCLDARPVIWSLNHHPEEWAYGGANQSYHGPSGHYILRMSPDLFVASSPNCSCHYRPFQQSQSAELNDALQNLCTGKPNREYPAPTVRAGYEANQFAGHFIR